MSSVLTYKDLDRPTNITVQSNNKDLGFLTFAKYGSAAVEAPEFRGASHLAEHLMCRAWDDMSNYFSTRGIDHNAFTDDFKVVYYFQGLDRHIASIMDDVLLRDKNNIFDWTPTKEDFERERSVVLQEYEGYLTKPHAAMRANIGRKYFNYYGPIGSDAALKALTYDQFVDFFRSQRLFDKFAYVGSRSWYRTPKFDHVSNYAAHDLDSIDYTATESVNPDFQPQYFGANTQETLLSDWFILQGVEPWEVKVLIALWNEGGPEAPLMKRLRYDTGLAYGAYMTDVDQIHPVLMSYVTVNPNNLNEARKLLHETLLNWETYITPERFNTIIEHNKIQLEIAGIKNYEYASVSRLFTVDSRLVTTAKLESLTYERICDIHRKNFTGDNIHLAEAGSVLVV